MTMDASKTKELEKKFTEAIEKDRLRARLAAKQENRRNDRGQRVLIKNLQKRRWALMLLLGQINSHWEIEDTTYRLYHGSYKVMYAMEITARVLKELEGLYRYGWRRRNETFKKIMEEGLDPHGDPRRWIEAMFHARYFLEMALKYSKEVKKPLHMLPSGYASLLYLYGLR